MPEEHQEGSARDATRLGGAAADFVGGLARKVAELRAAISAIGAMPAAKDRERGRDEVRRKLHALGVGARLLHFEVLSKALAASTERIDDEATRGEVSDALLGEVGTLLDRIPDLASAKHVLTPTPPPIGLDAFEPEKDAPEESGALPWTVVVVGDEALAHAVAADPGLFPCDVERTADPLTALEIARLVAPELLIVDVELPGAIDLVDALFEDPATSALPLLAYGSPEDEGGSARLVALGVTRIIHRGTSAAELRAECAAQVEAARAPVREVMHPELGEVTVAQLADRLVDEVRRALVGDVAPDAKTFKVSLGVGAEILGPMWGALARVRDVVSAKSGGGIAFENHAGHSALAMSIAAEPEIPVEIALTPTPPPLGSSPRRPRARAEGSDVDLGSRIVVVADDDPQVLWFISDVLKQAGALVLEAKDGQEALALARGSGADAIITDVLMPRVDGLTLARTLRRDVALRDRPIIMLSWKEDLLKRLRDLRMESQVMLRKEADGRTILARVREVLAPRARVEARIAAGGEVRGRLDDLSIASLVEIVNRVRREAQLVVRDAANVYEVELDGGGIRSLARVSTDGVKNVGISILPSLLGVVGGRFLVRPLALAGDGQTPRDLEGDLSAQLAPVLRKLRAACDAVSGARTIDVARVQLDDAQLSAYLRATPQPMRGLLERIAAGTSPRALMLGGEVAPATLEDVLLDVASRGLVTRVTSSSAEDLLALADKALDGPPAPLVDKPRAQPKLAPIPETDAFDLAPSIAPPPKRPEAAPEVVDGSPDSLTDAVLQASAPGERNSLSRTLIDTRELKPRSVRSDPPPGAAKPTSNPPEARTISATTTPAPSPAKSKDERSDTLSGLGIDRLGSKGAEETAEPIEPELVAPAAAAKVESAPATPERLEKPERPEKKEEPRPTSREPKDQILEDLARERSWTRRRTDDDPRAARAARDTTADDRIAARRRRGRATDDVDDRDALDDDRVDAREKDVSDSASKRGRRAADRDAGPPTKERTEAARKQLRSDGAFWWIVLALGVIGASIAFAVQQRDDSDAKRKAAASGSSSTSTAPSAPPKLPPAASKSGP